MDQGGSDTLCVVSSGKKTLLFDDFGTILRTGFILLEKLNSGIFSRCIGEPTLQLRYDETNQFGMKTQSIS